MGCVLPRFGTSELIHHTLYCLLAINIIKPMGSV
jgi:hypothetical protein